MNMTEQEFLADRFGKPVGIWLLTGIRLVGVLIGEDAAADVVFLRPLGGGTSEIQMISKLAISTISSIPASDVRKSATELHGTLSAAHRGRS